MKNSLKIYSFLGATMVFSCVSYNQNAHASPKYGMAGCGLGSLIFEENTGFLQVLAATTNGTSGSQTFGITSGTSNCTTGVNVTLQRQKDFVAANLATLQREVANGSGETVNGLAYVLGCPEDAYGAFGVYSQAHYAQVFNTSSPEAVLINLKAELSKNTALSNSCTLALG